MIQITLYLRDPSTNEKFEKKVWTDHVMVTREHWEDGKSIHIVPGNEVPTARNWGEYTEILRRAFGSTHDWDPDLMAPPIRCWVKHEDKWRVVTVEWPDKPKDLIDWWAGAR